MMGLTKDRASSRVNRYETKSSGVDLDGLGKLAETLQVPMAYLVAEDEATAEILLSLAALSPGERRELATKIKDEARKSDLLLDIKRDSDEESG